MVPYSHRIPASADLTLRFSRLLVIGAALVAVLMSGCHLTSGGRGGPPADVLSTPDRRVRVRLDKQVPQFMLAVEGPCVIDDDRGRRLVEPLAELKECFVTPNPAEPEGFLLGDTPLPGPVLRILPSEDGSLVYNNRHYRGYLVAKRQGEGFLVINVVDIESYLRGVLCGELPKRFHPETFRAQVIASRTYALYQRSVNGPKRTWDVTSDTSSQVYRGRDEETTTANEAVDATAGIVCAWESPHGRKIFCTYFSSTCGGMNQNVVNVKGGETIPPLKGGVKCEFCKGSEWYRWKPVRLTKESITSFIKPYLVRSRYTGAEKLGRIDEIKILTRTPGGRAIRLQITDEAGLTFNMRAEDFRLLINNGQQIKSTFFEVENEPGAITFTDGRGYGHGIGMCQHGAEGMARRGYKAGQILQHYYPGCILVKAY